MTIVPMGDRVLIKKEEKEEKTVGGLILAAAAQEESNMAEIIAVGPKADENLTVGTKVIYAKFAGDTFEIDGKECLLVKSEDILAIVK